MDDSELARLQEIDDQLYQLEPRLARVSRAWSLLSYERKMLQAEIKNLRSEQEALTQGQLVFHV
jgi:chromosome segregation ATPase